MEPNMAKNDKLPVSVRSVTRRIGRKLPDHQQLKKAGAYSAEWQEENGRFFIVDTAKGTIIERDADLESLARRLGALEPWERLADDD
jgi:hypothetical protein